jgi:predicted membrane-bound mannosyltransferase
MKLSQSRIDSNRQLRSWSEFSLFIGVVFLAILLRFWDLSGMPSGVHGDEGIVGYEARRILQEGSIGPFSPASFGQPSGPIYLSALAELVFGETIFAIRFV